MNSNDQWFELAQIIVSDIVRHWRSIIMMMLVFAMGADMFLTLTYQPFYRSEATFALKPVMSIQRAVRLIRFLI